MKPISIVRGFYVLLFFVLLSPAYSQQINPIQVIGIPQLEALLSKPSDTLYVVNFWATWCGPCVAELPHIEKFREQYAAQPVKVILISLDFISDLDKRLPAFVKKKKLRSQLMLMNDTDYNQWIDKVESSWQGNIPVTLIFNNARHIRKFINGPLQAGQLEQIVAPLLEQNK